MEWSNYTYLYFSKIADGYLLYSSLSNRILKLDRDGYDQIKQIIKNPEILDPNDEFSKALSAGRFLVNSNESEINKIKLSTLLKRFSPDTLSLTIAPTRACNFSCPYCYEKDRINKKMSKKVQDGIIDFVRQNEHIKTLGVVWYGGEPTLQINTIKYLSAELQKLVPNYSAFMVTNAYLLDKIADYVDDLKISNIQITLDGTEETHNRTRCLKNGNATFEKIIENIDILLKKSSEILISIRMNISTENSTEYVKLFHYLKNRFPQRVNLYPAFVKDYTGNCHADFCYDNGVKKAEFLKKIFKEDGVYTKDMYPIRMNKGCMVQSMNSYVVGPEGELYKCWHHLGNQNKVVGNILTDGSITNFELLSNIMIRHDAINDEKCLKCILFPSCDGGCTDHKDSKTDYCIPAKSMIEDIIDARYIIRNSMSSQ